MSQPNSSAQHSISDFTNRRRLFALFFARPGLTSVATALATAAEANGTPTAPTASARSLQMQPALPGNIRQIETAHYHLYSSAAPNRISQVAKAVESLYQAYVHLFKIPSSRQRKKLELVLYRDRQEFKAHNISKPWAEAYYLEPRCHAYYADGANPYHWMLHEATHQLVREVSGFRLARWLDEGLACYLGTSRMKDGHLKPGVMDPHAYPVWWLARHPLTGNIARDIADHQIIPLEQLIRDTGPPLDRHVNTYYLHYWSMARFLMHHRNGMYAAGFRKLLATDGKPDEFRRLIGPMENVQAEWYAYFLKLVRNSSSSTP